MSEEERTLVDKSESSSFEDLASAAAHEIEEAKIAEAAAAEKEKIAEPKTDEWQDVLGSGALLKKILKPGKDSESRPNRSDICRISYEIKIRDTGDLVEKRDQVKIYLGDNEVLQGMDLALTLMHEGEENLLQLAPRFAYGETGLKTGESLGTVGELDGPKYDGPNIGPETWLEVRLELHDWNEEPEHETLPIAERMQIGTRRRARGNWWYGRGEPILAVQLYRRALDVLDESEGGITDPTPSGQMAPTSDALKALLDERLRVHNNMAAAQLKAGAYDAALQYKRREPILDVLDESEGGITDPTPSGQMAPTSDALKALLDERLRVHNNMAAAQLKAGAYDAALQAVTRVLQCQPDNAKALYRKSRILSAMGRNSEALEAARAAAAAAPDDSGTKKELQRCEQRANRDRSVERRLAKRMLGTSDQPKGSPDKKPSRAKMFVWGSLLLSLLVGVASVLVYRYKLQH